eukprot:g52723.t1
MTKMPRNVEKQIVDLRLQLLENSKNAVFCEQSGKIWNQPPPNRSDCENHNSTITQEFQARCLSKKHYQMKLDMMQNSRDELERQLAAVDASIGKLKAQMERDAAVPVAVGSVCAVPFCLVQHLMHLPNVADAYQDQSDTSGSLRFTLAGLYVGFLLVLIGSAPNSLTCASS